MARDADFIELYKILGLNADCELAEFKHAYRRRVQILHPDRRGYTPSDRIAAERLQQLTALYGAAMEFQRQHGRLPGARRVRETRATSDPPTDHQAVDRPPRGLRPLSVMLLFSILLWVLWSATPTSNRTSPPAEDMVPTVPESAINDDGLGARKPTNVTLTLGMPASIVRTLEGAPLIINADRWEYGPSWILFQNNQVTDWYSSPVRPLKSTSQIRP